MREGARRYWVGHWGPGKQPYVFFISGSFFRGSHVSIVPVFLNQHPRLCVCVCVCVCV
jgi:hypothetical protein